ncbi:blue-light photoreceptor [mine drainage metagenome]|uniref:histidine kinase n=1 Tax=mine drainage metagenome TaxID=410659 RepID=A0A1J5T8W2_9ZZZZ
MEQNKPNTDSSHKLSPNLLYKSLIKSDINIFILLSFSIFISEILIMLLLKRLPSFSTWSEAVIDSFILSVIIFPIIYIFLFKPLRANILKLKKEEAGLKESEKQLKLLSTAIKNATDGVVITEIDPADITNQIIIYVNDAYVEMSGYSIEEVIGKTPKILQGKKTDKEELRRIREAILNYKPYEMEILNYKKNGKVFWSTVSITPVANAEGVYTHWVGIKRDVTNQKKHQRDIRKATIAAQEKEKYFIGSELHDNVLQLLIGSLFSASLIKNLSGNDLVRMDELKNHILTSINEIRNLSHQLAPAGFKESALKESFEMLLNSFNADDKLNILLDFDDEVNQYLYADLQLNLYRILQTQMQNIVKHAEATVINVSLKKTDDKLRLEIADNGKGFDLQSIKGDGIGLSNIRNRTEIFEGNLTINTSVGNGCEMIVEIPVS